MIFDELDFFILNQIWSKRNTTTWKIAKNSLGVGDNYPRERKVELNSLHEKIKNRLKKMSEVGLVSISKDSNNKNIYDLNTKNIKIGRHKFPDKYSNAICLRVNAKWEVFQTL